MKALVTGATGFIGGALVEHLLAAGWLVHVLVRPASVRRLAGPERYQVSAAELDERARVRHAAQGCDVVFHAAAIRNRWGTPSEAYRQVNVEGTRHLLEASIGYARRFVYISSVGVLGYPGMHGIDESFPILTRADTTDYHSSKAQAEQIVRERADQVETVVIRPTITYGPGDADGMFTRMIDMRARGRWVHVGNGRNHFHLTFIDDLLRGLELAATRAEAIGQTLILAGPASIQVRELAAMIEDALGVPHQRFYVPEVLARGIGACVERAYAAGLALHVLPRGLTPPITPDKIDTLCMHRGFSSARAGQRLGYTPRVGYAEGLARTIQWMVTTGRLHLPQPTRCSATGHGYSES